MNKITYRPINLDTDKADYYAAYREDIMEKYGSFNMSEKEVCAELVMPGFDVTKDTRLALTEDGKIVGFVQVFTHFELPVRPRIYAWVAQDYRNQGIGTALNEWGIERAKDVYNRVPDDARVVIQCYGKLDEENQFLENMGFTSTRNSLQMNIEFETAPPEVEFPESMALFTYAEHPHLEDFVRIQQESFRDHRGFTEQPLEKVTSVWKNFIDAAEDFDPELMILLREGTNDVGMVFAWQASEEEADRAYIETLGVTRDYRRRGLGLKLLQYMFSQLYKKGLRKAALGVDASSLTGATKLYEKAGMYVAHVYNAYELEIRAGKEYSNQGQVATEVISE